MSIVAALVNFGFIIGLWGWVCFLIAICMVASEKNRSAFWAFVAYLFTGPAAVFYYFAVPALPTK
jgi:hypothetical protein